MYEDGDERMEAAERLAGLDPRAGAEAFRAIAGDDGADDEQRIDAAEQLARLDPRTAAEAFRAIACDGSVGDGLRVEAAERLPELDRQAAAYALRMIACDETLDDGLRSSAAEQLPALDPWVLEAHPARRVSLALEGAGRRAEHKRVIASTAGVIASGPASYIRRSSKASLTTA